MAQNISTLNHSFAIDKNIRFRDAGGGFPVADITTGHGTAAVALQGAHLLSWTPAGHEPVIWMSEDAQFASGKSIRGGTPVCWPWFGAHASETASPAHGFARTSLWTVTATEQLPDENIRIAKSGSASTIVWNPWQQRAAEMGEMGKDGYRSML